MATWLVFQASWGEAPKGVQFSSADCRFQAPLSVCSASGIGLHSMLQDQGGGGAAWVTWVVAFAVFF